MNLSPQQIDNLIDQTPPMDKKRRVYMKSVILIILMAFMQVNNAILTDQWLEVWSANKLQQKFADEKVQEYFQDLLIKLRAVWINLIIVFNDEFINHHLHLWSSILIPLGDAPWQYEIWWEKYYTQVWHKCNTNTRIEWIDDEHQLVENKSGYFEENINHEPVWEIIHQWIKDSQIIEQIVQVKTKQIKLENVQISPTMLVFFYELTNTLYQRNLASQIKKKTKINDEETEEEWVNRPWHVSPETKKWICQAYSNKKSLIYVLMYEAWDSQNNKINKSLKNGIKSYMDPTIRLEKFVKKKIQQKCVLYNLSYMIMKYLIFKKLLRESIHGAFAWSYQTIHSPIQKIFNTLEMLWFAHCWHPANNDENVNDTADEHVRMYQWATPLQRIFWKYCQNKSVTILGFSHPDKSADKILLPTFCMHDDSNLYTVPLSTGWCTHSHSTLTKFSSKVKHTFTGGLPWDNIEQWESKMQTTNSLHIPTEKALTAKVIKEEKIQIKQIIMNVMSSIDWQWTQSDVSNPHCFYTKLKASDLKDQYWKYFNVIPKQWEDSKGTKGVSPIHYENKFYGYKWRFRHVHSWRAIQSLEYTTCAHFLKQHGETVVDTGMQVTGTAWIIDDFPPKKNEMTSQLIPKNKDEFDNEPEVSFTQICPENSIHLQQNQQTGQQSNQCHDAHSNDNIPSKQVKHHNGQDFLVISSDSDSDIEPVQTRKKIKQSPEFGFVDLTNIKSEKYEKSNNLNMFDFDDENDNVKTEKHNNGNNNSNSNKWASNSWCMDDSIDDNDNNANANNNFQSRNNESSTIINKFNKRVTLSSHIHPPGHNVYSANGLRVTTATPLRKNLKNSCKTATKSSKGQSKGVTQNKNGSIRNRNQGSQSRRRKSRLKSNTNKNNNLLPAINSARTNNTRKIKRSSKQLDNDDADLQMPQMSMYAMSQPPLSKRSRKSSNGQKH